MYHIYGHMGLNPKDSCMCDCYIVGIMLKDNYPTCGESTWKETGDTEKDDHVSNMFSYLV